MQNDHILLSVHETKTIERDGFREVLHITRYENEQVQARQFYRNGKREGRAKGWYRSGKIMLQVFWQDDKLEGESKFWHENGKIWHHCFYRAGELIDKNFNLSKKLTIRRIVKHFRKRITNPIKCLFISDLTKIVIHFV